jgi:homoisocitrate dehydrogenase
MRICIIPGDGIGPEVMGAARRVLTALAPETEFVEAEAGWATFQREKSALPEETIAAARGSDAVLFGAVASPSHAVPGYTSPIVQLRRALDLYANIRPTFDVQRPEIDLVVVRENTEDLYVGRERLEDNGDTAIAERLITRRASERIARVACERAQQRRGKLTIVHKANVLRVSDGLFRDCALAIAAQYPKLDVNELLVDVAAMHLAQSPQRFDVLVTTNMFGDILSDVACIHGGGLGLASSANIGEQHTLFEPVHGAAPDIAGKGIANPLAAIGCVAMLLEQKSGFGLQDSEGAAPGRAAQLCAALRAVIMHGPHTPDMGGMATTDDVTEAILAKLQRGNER